jgi:hypothetical protein
VIGGSLPRTRREQEWLGPASAEAKGKLARATEETLADVQARVDEPTGPERP